MEKYKSKFSGKKKLKENYIEGDLSRLGYREIGMLADSLELYADRKLTRNAHNYFDSLESWGFNMSSGFIFLIDEDYNVIMKNGRELDIFIALPYSGEEGFPEDFDGRDIDDFDTDDVEYLENFGTFKNGVYKSN